jgi:hypothetical protein
VRARLGVETLCMQVLLILGLSQAGAGWLNAPASTQSINQFKASPNALVAPGADARTIEALVDLAGTNALLAADLVHIAEVTQRRFQNAIPGGGGVDAVVGLNFAGVATKQDNNFRPPQQCSDHCCGSGEFRRWNFEQMAHKLYPVSLRTFA